MENNIEKQKNIARLIRIIFYSICISCALYFLLKGEDSPYDFSTSGGSGERPFRERDVSTFTYYMVWPESERNYVSKIEYDYLPLYLMLHGYTDLSDQDIDSIRSGKLNLTIDLPVTLTEKMKNNMIKAMVFVFLILIIGTIDVLSFFQKKKNARKLISPADR